MQDPGHAVTSVAIRSAKGTTRDLCCEQGEGAEEEGSGLYLFFQVLNVCLAALARLARGLSVLGQSPLHLVIHVTCKCTRSTSGRHKICCVSVT